MAVQVQAAGLDPEPVQPQAAAGQRGDDDGDLGGGLAAAHRPEPDPGQRGQVDPGGGVQVHAGQVVGQAPALHHRQERQVRGDLAQFQVAGHGAVLVLAHRKAGAGEHERLAHPVLGGGEVQPADPLGVAGDASA